MSIAQHLQHADMAQANDGLPETICHDGPLTLGSGAMDALIRRTFVHAQRG